MPDAILQALRITEIAAYTFSSCPITGIIIPTGITSIGSNAFQGCLFLTYISLPETVSSIGKDAFLHVPTEVYTVYDGAYYLGNWKNPHHILIQAIDKNIDSCQIHENTKVLAPGAFQSCKNLTEITVPNHIYRIPSSAFASSGLRRVTIEYGITEIESSAFDNCGLLEAIIIPGSVLTIGKSAFSRCSKLESVMIEEGIQSIEDSAFSMTDLLDTITLPKTLTSIGKLMFYCSGDLQDITYNGTKAQWNALPKGSDWDYSMGGRDGGGYISASYTVHCADGDLYGNR